VKPAELELGVVVGETQLDAVAMDRRSRLLAKAKVFRVAADLRTNLPNLRTHLGAVVRAVIADGSLDPRRIERVVVATHTRSSLLAQPGLKRVGVLRIGGPLTYALPPLSGWPTELRTRVSAGEAVVRGGAEYDGRPGAALDEAEIARFLDEVAREADSIAITSVFSPVAPEQELAAAELVRRELGPDTHVSLSHEIGSIGLLERENATVLNGALAGALEAPAAIVRDALESEGVGADVLVTQNDGTLMTLEHARRFPVLLLGNGPASAMRGAAYLSGVEDGLVVEVGGSRTDIGALVGGLPRESTRPTRIEGVRVAFRMPDVRTLAFGSCSLLDLRNDPPSIGEGIGQPLALGGSAPTLVDAARSGPDDGGLRDALRLAREALAGGVDRAKAELESPPLVAVGADELVPSDLPGVSEVIRPPDRDLARAIGAAMAPVSGRAECICPNQPEKRHAALDEVRASACAEAVYAGADPAAVTVVQVEEQPLTYLSDPAIRIRVKAAGPPG
jgi:N-methylhydantoinase A/oxoprolinase/acetone carboxylase beta subunit